MHFEQKVRHANALAHRAQNYAVFSSVFLPPDLASFAMETTLNLVLVNIEADLLLVERVRGEDPMKPHRDLEALGPRIEELERRIRAVLAPATGGMEAPASLPLPGA